MRAEVLPGSTALCQRRGAAVPFQDPDVGRPSPTWPLFPRDSMGTRVAPAHRPLRLSSTAMISSIDPGSHRSPRRAGPLTGVFLLSVPLLVSLACSDDITNQYITNQYGDAGADSAGGESGAGGEGTRYPGAPEADTEVAEHSPDVFGSVGIRYWFAVSDEQLEEMNEGLDQGGPIVEQVGDIYVPGGSVAGNYADHLWVTTPGRNGKTADYGKVEVKIVGQSTLRPWSRRSIPNLNVDFDEFVEDQEIGGFEHLRFNNAQVGSIFRERVTLELYSRLKYPAPRATYGWVSSNVWGAGVAVPYVVVERYKRTFCERWEDEIGGGCANIWEFVGDFAQSDGIPGGPGVLGSVFDDPNVCEFSECDDARGRKLEATVKETPLGDGFKKALSKWIHWPSFHRFQCLSWVLATGDDALHNMNNVVLMERGDGLFQYLPYSVDISLGQEWYPTVPLPGSNSIARGCQSDAACWADTIAACEDLIAEFEDLDPQGLLDGVHEELASQGMLRPGDEERYQALRDWFEERLSNLPAELEDNREQPLVCQDGQVDCGGYCDYYENCGNNCEPPLALEAAGAGGADGAGGGGGEAGSDGGVCTPIEHYGLLE